MHVARNRRTYVAKSGEQRVYESVLVRRTYRDGGKVRHETLANLSALPGQAVDAIEAALKGERLVPAGHAVTITASVPHGHVAAVHAMAVQLGLPSLLGPACAERDLALALVISRVVAPASRLSTLAWWADTTLGADLGVAAASTDQVYAAMDWLAGRRSRIRRDCSVAGSAAGRPRLLDGRRQQIEYGLHREGRPAAVPSPETGDGPRHRGLRLERWSWPAAA